MTADSPARSAGAASEAIDPESGSKPEADSDQEPERSSCENGRGEIRDAKTLVGLFYALSRRPGGLQIWRR